MNSHSRTNFSSWTVKEIEQYLLENPVIDSTVISQLQSDPRKGVRERVARYFKRRNNDLKGLERLNRLTRKERLLEEQGFACIAGVDEAGRGPLAGPVVAAAVILKEKPYGLFKYVDDSKKLSPKKRKELYETIIKHALAVNTAVIGTERIDQVNIFQASLEAMHQSIIGLSVSPDFILTDGFKIPELSIAQEAIKGGDSLCLSISAASIIAKVTRDKIMEEYGYCYQGYGFEQNKGYPTAEHKRAIKELGPTPIHRRSFSLD